MSELKKHKNQLLWDIYEFIFGDPKEEEKKQRVLMSAKEEDAKKQARLKRQQEDRNYAVINAMMEYPEYWYTHSNKNAKLNWEYGYITYDKNYFYMYSKPDQVIYFFKTRTPMIKKLHEIITRVKLNENKNSTSSLNENKNSTSSLNEKPKLMSKLSKRRNSRSKLTNNTQSTSKQKWTPSDLPIELADNLDINGNIIVPRDIPSDTKVIMDNDYSKVKNQRWVPEHTWSKDYGISEYGDDPLAKFYNSNVYLNAYYK